MVDNLNRLKKLENLRKEKENEDNLNFFP